MAEPNPQPSDAIEESRQLLRSLESAAGQLAIQVAGGIVLDRDDDRRLRLLETASGISLAGLEPPGMFDLSALHQVHARCCDLLPSIREKLSSIAIGVCSVVAPNACLLRSAGSTAIAINADLLAYLSFANAILLSIHRAVVDHDTARFFKLLEAYAVLAHTSHGKDRHLLEDQIFAAAPEDYQRSGFILEAQLLFVVLHEVGHLGAPSGQGRWFSMINSGIEGFEPSHEGEFAADQFAASTLFCADNAAKVSTSLPFFGDTGPFRWKDLPYYTLTLFPLLDAMPIRRYKGLGKPLSHPAPMIRLKRILSDFRDTTEWHSRSIQDYLDRIALLRTTFDVN